MLFDLHVQLQQHYAGETGAQEVRLDGGFIADVVRDGIIYEIQTRAARHIRAKIKALLGSWPVVVVLPVARNTTIIRQDYRDLSHEISRRISPKHGTALDVFTEAVSLAKLISHENFAIEIITIDVDEIRRELSKAEQKLIQKRRKRRWRSVQPWEVINRQLVTVHESVRLDTPRDGLKLLPSVLPDPFTTQMLAEATNRSRWRAGQIAYTLYHAGTLAIIKRTREGNWYTPVPA